MRNFAHDVESLTRTEDIRCDEEVGFDIFGLSKDVLRGLDAIGFKQPSPVQLRAIPYGRCGVDLVVQSKSGTGKTCVFSVVALDALDISRGLQVIVLAPTHEIALQDSEVVQAIGRKIQNLSVATCIGGHGDEKKKLKSCHIIVGSPGRVRYLIEKSKISVQSVRMFILDEADYLVAQDKIRQDVNWICSALPDSRQTIALSATFTPKLSEYVAKYMNSPTHIKMSPKTAVLLGVRQLYHYVSSVKFDGSYSRAKFGAVKEILETVDFKQCIIFYNNHDKAEALHKELSQTNPDWIIGFISSQLDQAKRSSAFLQLRQGKSRVVVSSDLICRGADAANVDLVLHLDFPHSVDTYLHRVGRAGRFGGQGVSIGIVALSQEFDLIQKYQEKLGIEILQIPYPPVKTLIADYEVKIPSCRIGDLVSAEVIETETLPNKQSTPNQSNLTSCNANSSSQAPRNILSYDDNPFESAGNDGTYSDMLASHEEISKFLNLTNSSVQQPPSKPYSQLEASENQTPILTKPLPVGPIDGSTDRSESSRIAQEYWASFSETSPSLESLVKIYGDSVSELNFSRAIKSESRSTSSATLLPFKAENLYPNTPTPTLVDSDTVLTKTPREKPEFREQAAQTENTGLAHNVLPSMHYIPMPPLMSAGGYSEFSEWLQLHGSLIYKPDIRFQHHCSCSCHGPFASS